MNGNSINNSSGNGLDNKDAQMTAAAGLPEVVNEGNEAEDLQSDQPEFCTALKKCSTRLQTLLEKEKYEDASVLISQMIDSRDTEIFNAVGQLTRALHEAIVNFNIDESAQSDLKENSDKSANEKVETSNDNQEQETIEIQDASDRLNYVIALTRNAADNTMDMIEQSVPIAESLGSEAKKLKEEWVKLRRREVTKEEFTELYQRIDGFLDGMCYGTEKMNANMQTILVEQGFQDLTGQVLKKVISLVKDVETELVSLVRMAGHLEEVTGIEVIKVNKKKSVDSTTAEGPQIHGDKRDDVMSTQDDVDDLLSSLGF